MLVLHRVRQPAGRGFVVSKDNGLCPLLHLAGVGHRPEVGLEADGLGGDEARGGEGGGGGGGWGGVDATPLAHRLAG